MKTSLGGFWDDPKIWIGLFNKCFTIKGTYLESFALSALESTSPRTLTAIMLLQLLGCIDN